MLSFSPVVDLVAPQKCVAFSIERGCVRVVYGSRQFSRYHVQACKTYPSSSAGYPTAEEAASIVTVALAEIHGEQADLVLCIPKEWVLVRSAFLPLAAAENLQQVLAFEFDRLTPFNAEDSMFDFAERPPVAEGIPVTIAATRADGVMAYLNALAEKGMTVSRVSFDISATASLVRFLSGREKFSFAATALHSVRGGAVLDGLLESGFSQDVNEPGKLSAPADVLSMVEAASAADAERTCYLISDENTAYLKDGISADADSPLRLLEDTEKRLPGVGPLHSGCAAVAGALVEHLWSGANGLNLLSQGVRRKVRPPLALTAALAIAVLVCVGIYIFMPLQVEEQRLKEIERQITLRKDEVLAVEKIKKEIDDVNREMSLVEKFKKEKPLYINIVREVTQLIPKNAWLTRVRIAGTQVNLEGYSPSASSLIEILEASKYFQKVEFASPTFRDARLNADRFQIKMELEGVTPEKQPHEKK